MRALDKEQINVVGATLEVAAPDKSFEVLQEAQLVHFYPSAEKWLDTFICLASTPAASSEQLSSLIDDIRLSLHGMSVNLLDILAFRRAIPAEVAMALPPPSDDLNLSEYALEAERIMALPSASSSSYSLVAATLPGQPQKSLKKENSAWIDLNKEYVAERLNIGGFCWHQYNYDSKAIKCRSKCQF